MAASHGPPRRGALAARGIFEPGLRSRQRCGLRSQTVLRRFHARRKDARRRALLADHGIQVDQNLTSDCEVWWAGEGSGTWPLLVRADAPARPNPDREAPSSKAPSLGALNADSVIYSVGIGSNVAWDLAVIERFGCEVLAFDPTTDALAFVAGERRANRAPEALRVQPIGLAAQDGTVRFSRPKKAGETNWRMDQPASDQATDAEFPVARWTTITQTANHTAIDVLKLDIEGGELRVIPDLLATGPLPTQLLVEFHHDLPGGRRRSGIDFQTSRSVIEQLRAAGYSLFAISSRGLEMGFARAVPSAP